MLFASYDPQNKPRVEVGEAGPTVTWDDAILGQPISTHADLLVLSTGIEPDESNRALADQFAVELTQDCFFQEAESKWRPVDFIKEGVFMCGIAHSPRSISESIATAEAAAQRALRILSSDRLAAGRIVAQVRHSLCSLCERCVDACPYGARVQDEDLGEIVVDELMCQGCGSCAAVCPNSASVLRGYWDQQMFEVIDAAMEASF